jgi:ribonucleotide reductase beta subunit family protein with ferritin-like domain/putative sterol carrier protein
MSTGLATAPSRRGASPTDAISYTDLYARWEKGNWSATELDFSQDRIDWQEAFSEFERRAALWNYAMFFHGEDSVADNLGPYIDAAPREEQKYFLATQQVDEARHAVFFKRFLHEVVGVTGSNHNGNVADALAATQPQLTWGFRKTFARLDRMADELRKDRSRPKLAAAITLYHLVIEAALAQPGQHFIESYVEQRGVLPGFRAGMRNVSFDEQRHIGFGVKLISDLIAEDPECVDAIVELLREVVPYTTAVLVPPGWDRRYTESFGFTLEDIYEHGAVSFESKLRAAGLPQEALDRIPMPFDLPPRERAERGIKLLEANLLGERLGPASRDPEAVEMLFDSIRRQADPRYAPGGAAIQWDFDDMEPWYLEVENGSTRAAHGRHAHPDLVLRCSWDDWVDLVAGREDPRRALLTRKLRPRGRLRMLLRMPKLLG